MFLPVVEAKTKQAPPGAGYKFRADYAGTQTYSDPILVTADVNNPVSIPVGGSAVLPPLEGSQATDSGLNRSTSQKTSFASRLTRNLSFIPSSGWNPALVIASPERSLGRGNPGTLTAGDVRAKLGARHHGYGGGDWHDRDTGLVRFGARDYDPATGKWTAKDPIDFAGGDLSLLSYAGQDPVNWVDYDGMVGVPAAEDEIPSVVILNDIENWHYSRNNNPAQQLAESYKYDYVNKLWTALPNVQSIYHRHGESGANNIKFHIYYNSSLRGAELVFNRKTERLDLSPENMGTYNYGLNPFSHFFLDMLPYYFWGNTPDDTTGIFKRIFGPFNDIDNLNCP